MQRPGRDQAGPPSPLPWAASPRGPEPSPTRVSDSDPLGATARTGRADPAGGPGGFAPAAVGQAGAWPAAGEYAPPGPYPPPDPYRPPGPYPPPGPGPAGDPGDLDGPADGGTAPGAPAGRRPAHRPSPWSLTRSELRTALAVVVAMAALGAPVALLWVQLAPRLAFRVVRPELALPVVPEAEEYVAADGRFALLTLGAGIVAGLACWLLRRSRGPAVVLALALGGLLGAIVTWRLGVWLSPGYTPQDLREVGRTVYQPLRLLARAALVLEPFAAVLVYLLGVGFARHNDLGRDGAEQSPAAGGGVVVSSGSA